MFEEYFWDLCVFCGRMMVGMCWLGEWLCWLKSVGCNCGRVVYRLYFWGRIFCLMVFWLEILYSCVGWVIGCGYFSGLWWVRWFVCFCVWCVVFMRVWWFGDILCLWLDYWDFWWWWWLCFVFWVFGVWRCWDDCDVCEIWGWCWDLVGFFLVILGILIVLL